MRVSAVSFLPGHAPRKSMAPKGDNPISGSVFRDPSAGASMPVTLQVARPIIQPPPVRHAASQGAPRIEPSEARQAERLVAPPDEEGFAGHLEAAIRNNRARRDVYDRLSGGATRSLSNQLIALERLTLPAAHALDLWAKGFQDQGIPVLQDDFVSMRNVRSPFAPPRWRGVSSAQEASKVETWLADYRKTIRNALGDDDFTGIAEASYALLKRLEATETGSQTHWAMSKHLVESLGLAAMNAIDHAEQSHGETTRLSRTFIRFQSLGLLGSASIDRKAQSFHQKGIGIVVNDVPHIPFAERWESHSPVTPAKAGVQTSIHR